MIKSDSAGDPHRIPIERAGVHSVTVIIFMCNGIDYTRRCLETLRANTVFPRWHIIAVDNGDTDGTLEYLKSQNFVTTIVNGPKNLDFVQGNNQAIACSDPTSDVLLLNDNIEVDQADWLERMQATAYSSPDIGIVGCRLASPDGALQHAGTYMPLDTFWEQRLGAGEKDINQYNDDRDVEGVVFAGVYIKREALTKIGLLDEDYFCYFSSSDYCFRAFQKGYRVVCCGSVTLTHHKNGSTALNDVKHKDVCLRARTVFREKWEDKLTASRYTWQIGWHSIFNFQTGYAISSRELACALDRKGVHVAYKYVYGPGTLFPKAEPEAADRYLVNLIHGRRLDPDRIQVVYGQGDVFESNFGRYKIGFTMLETDGIPAEWVRQANLMNEVWVPSSFNARTFRDSGVERPIRVIPLGVDPEYFNPKILCHPLVGVYTFLSVFEWGERKMPELLLKAFNDEFRSSEPVVLLCKVLNVDTNVDVRAQVAALGLDPKGGKIHFSVNQLIPAYQLGSLYCSADCFVLPTRGEGWGMPVIEAMACGLPVIATDWSAHCDFMNAQNAYPLRVERMVPARARCPYYSSFRWAEPSYHHLRHLMRHVFENPTEARAKGEKASHDVRTGWTWDHAAQKIIDRIDQIASEAAGHIEENLTEIDK